MCDGEYSGLQDALHFASPRGALMLTATDVNVIHASVHVELRTGRSVPLFPVFKGVQGPNIDPYIYIYVYIYICI